MRKSSSYIGKTLYIRHRIILEILWLSICFRHSLFTSFRSVYLSDTIFSYIGHMFQTVIGCPKRATFVLNNYCLLFVKHIVCLIQRHLVPTNFKKLNVIHDHIQYNTLFIFFHSIGSLLFYWCELSVEVVLIETL